MEVNQSSFFSTKSLFKQKPFSFSQKIKSFSILFLLILPILSMVSFAPAYAGDADIVIMLDLTGSTSPKDLELEKEAARSMLGYLNGLTPKPRVAIGSFNVKDEKATSPVDAARIVPGGELTADYGTLDLSSTTGGTGLYGAIKSVAIPQGYTDIGAAINVAQAQLESGNGLGARYIILISDGTSNRPGPTGYSDCDPCGCPNAQNVSSIAATEAKTKGTTIIGVHYTGNAFNSTCPNEPEAGFNFLKNSIVSSPTTFFEGTGNLDGIFTQLSCTVKCDDGNKCTTDSCNADSGQCEYVAVNSDSDGDQVVDCQDLCKGDDRTLGSNCSSVTIGANNAECVVNGIYSCSSQGSVSCQPTTGVEPVCSGCVSTDYSSDLTNLSKERAKAYRALNKTIKGLKKIAKLSDSESEIQKKAKSLYKSNSTSVRSIPAQFQNCSNTVQCSTVFEDIKYSSIEEETKYYSKGLKTVIKAVKKARKGALTAEDSNNRKNLKAAIKNIKAILAKLPKTRSQCQ